MTCQKHCYAWARYSALFLAGVALLFLRNPDPITHPIVFAEDGTWTALGLREGWLVAFAFSRTDYFVFLNTLLLYVSSVLSRATGGGSINYLPYAIAVVSYSFYSAFAVLVFSTVKRVSSPLFAIFGFLLVLMIPLGNTQNEVIGRILQVGFFMPAIALMLFFWRERCDRVIVRRCIDLAIFVAAGTNPVVFVVAFAYFLYALFLRKIDLISILKNHVLLILLLSALAIAMLFRAPGEQSIPGAFVAGNLVEAIVARSILFPIVFPWYGALSNTLSLLIFAIFVVIVVAAMRVPGNPEIKGLIGAVATTIVVYTLLTIVMRPGLTGLLNQYRTSFPDRYFMGINVLVSMLIVLVIAQLACAARLRMLCAFVSVSIVFVYAYGIPAIFELGKSRMPIRTHLSFVGQMCVTEKNGDFYDIQIYPELPKWHMRIPAKYVNQAACKFHSYEDLGLARPGREYKMIPSAPLSKETSVGFNFFDFPTKRPMSRVGIMFGTYSRVNSGEARLILKNAQGGFEKIDFSLESLVDNQYRSFEVPEGVYVSGEIRSVTGSGVSVWESLDQTGNTLGCATFRFVDGSEGFTPGCPGS